MFHFGRKVGRDVASLDVGEVCALFSGECCEQWDGSFTEWSGHACILFECFPTGVRCFVGADFGDAPTTFREYEYGFDVVCFLFFFLDI